MSKLNQYLEALKLNTIQNGIVFNYNGKTFKVIKVGETESRCKSITENSSEEKVIDNKIISRSIIKD